MNSTIQKRIEAIQSGETPKGYKKTKWGTIPVTWETAKVAQVGEITTGSTPSTSNKSYFGNRYLWVTPTDINCKYITSTNTKLSEEGIKKVRFLEKNSILVTCIASIGKNAILTEAGACNQQINAIAVNDNYNHEFIYYKMCEIAPVLERFAGKTATPIINKIQFSNLILAFPPLPEQEAIAEILTQQDRLINLLQKRIDEKRRQKKYLMQTLLTGITRFPGFEGKWKTKTLGEIGSTYGGLTGKSSSDFGSGHPFIPYLNIYQNIIVDNNTYGYVSVLEGEKQNLVQYGDILVTTSSETPDEVGICSLYLGNQKKLFLNSFCFGFRLFDQDNINLVYLINYLRCGVVRNKLNKLAQGATRYNLSKNEFMKIQISLPPLPEQETIAEILSTADEELSLLEQELEQEKLRKKALMQLLLTGLVRVEEL